MEDRLFSIGLRDLFRHHCNKNHLSAERACEDIVSYFYDDPDCEEALDLYNDVHREIHKLRYPPKGKNQRDKTFENSKIIKDIDFYLLGKEPDYYYALQAFKKTYLLHTAFHQQESEKENKLDSYAAYCGKTPADSFPESLGYIINHTEYNHKTQGVLICFENFNSMLRFSEEISNEVNPYKIVSLRFFETTKPKNDFALSISTENLEDCCKHHLFGILLPSNDNTVALRDFFHDKTYIAQYKEKYIDSLKTIEWKFINEHPEFKKSFKRYDREKDSFPTMEKAMIGKNISTTAATVITDAGTPIPFNRLRSPLKYLKHLIPIAKDFFYKNIHNLRYKTLTLRYRNDIFILIQLLRYKEAIRLIDRKPALINKTNEVGNTPIFLAIQLGANPVVKYLVKTEKINYAHRNRDGESILEFVALSNNLDINIKKTIIKNFRSSK